MTEPSGPFQTASAYRELAPGEGGYREIPRAA